jgi:hypothetical protein
MSRAHRAGCERLSRAWELAGQLAEKNDLLLRYTRVTLIQPLKKWIEQEVKR